MNTFRRGLRVCMLLMVSGIGVGSNLSLAQSEAPPSSRVATPQKYVYLPVKTRVSGWPRTEAAFFEQYASDDTARALIHLWYRKRGDGTVLLILGTVCVTASVAMNISSPVSDASVPAPSAGGIGYVLGCIFTFGLGCQGGPPSGSGSSTVSSSQPSTDYLGTGLLVGGGAMMAGGIALHNTYSTRRLIRILNGERPLKVRTLEKALRKYGQKVEAIESERALSKPATTEEQAQRQQREYWKKRNQKVKVVY